jgi:hypothetical protein
VPSSLGVAAAQVLLGELLRQRHVVLVEVADALGDAEIVVVPAVALQVLRRPPELRHRLDGVLLPGVLLAEPDSRGDVVGVQVDQLFQRVQARLGVAGLLVMRGDRLPFLGGVAHQPELLVQLGEAHAHLDAIDDLEDLLIERDRLEVEALLRVRPRHLLEAVGRLRLAVHLLVQLGQLLQDADVVRIDLEDAQILLHRFVERAFRDQLRGRLDDLVFVHRPGARCTEGGGVLRQRVNVTGNLLCGQGCRPR